MPCLLSHTHCVVCPPCFSFLSNHRCLHPTQKFYRARRGESWDRRFTIVSGLTPEGVDACGMLDRGSEIWLNWNKGDDASLRQFRCVRVVVAGAREMLIGWSSRSAPLHSHVYTQGAAHHVS